MSVIHDLEHEFRRHKHLADQALAAVDDGAFFARPGPMVNPVALIVKHLAGNYQSRWTDFLISDGEKPSRDRDAEFQLTDADTRAGLLDAWERGWHALFATLAVLREADLDRVVTIRGEAHTVRQALLRGATHTAYHVGQIMYVARLLSPEHAWATIAPGGSRQHVAGYRKPPGGA